MAFGHLWWLDVQAGASDRFLRRPMEDRDGLEMTRYFLGRPLDRYLAIREGMMRCPRKGRIPASECIGCPSFCRRDRVTKSVVCSYPLLARDTFALRSRGREDVRIALAHHLERT